MFRSSLLALVLSISLSSGGLAEPTPLTEPQESSLNYLVGTYRVVGQWPQNGATYSGTISLKRHGAALDVRRVIGGKVTLGTAFLASVTGDKIPVLQMQFTVNGVKHEGTYLWRGDLNNYARISGYVYRMDGKTTVPGIEALFNLDALK